MSVSIQQLHHLQALRKLQKSLGETNLGNTDPDLVERGNPMNPKRSHLSSRSSLSVEV